MKVPRSSFPRRSSAVRQICIRCRKTRIPFQAILSVFKVCSLCIKKEGGVIPLLVSVSQAKAYQLVDNAKEQEQYLDENGYYRFKTTRVLVHRFLCRKVNGTFPHDWHVHHVNFNKQDNHPENLIAIPGWMHKGIHEEMRKKGLRYNKGQIAARLNSWKFRKNRKARK